MKQIKIIFFSFVLFFISLFVFFRLVGPIPFFINSVNTNKSDSFTVTGEGKYSVMPDIAYVTVGVLANGKSVKTVQSKINSTINKVAAALKKLGVEEKDLKTVNYNINPIYDWSNGKQRVSGYTASVNLSIKVRDLDKINDIIDESTRNGSNMIGDISFDVEDKTKAEEEARKEAISEAKRKAQEAAKIVGFKLGKIVNYSESKNGNVILPTFSRSKLGIAEEDSSTQLLPGSTEVSITVSLSYQIE